MSFIFYWYRWLVGHTYVFFIFASVIIAQCSLCEQLLPKSTDRVLSELGPYHTAPFHMKIEQNLSVLALRSHCSAVKMELFQNANENGAFWKQSVFNVNTKNGDVWKRFTFLCWKAVESNVIMSIQWHSNPWLVLSRQLLTKALFWKRDVQHRFAGAVWTPTVFIAYSFENGAMWRDSIDKNW